ncbi:hypothetical protein YC2023_033191 [Brassica napus]
MLRDDGDRRKRHDIYSFRIFQPQPSRGKKRQITNWFLLVLGPILRSDFLQSLVPDGSWSCPQIRLLAVPGSCWFWVLSSDQTSCSPWFLLVLSPILRSDPRSLRICRFRVPTQSRCLQLLTPAGSGSSLHNKSQQPSDPMGAAITKQALDDIHTSRLTTPPHMRKMQGSQAGHNIFRRGLQLGRILKTGGVRRRAPGNTNLSGSGILEKPNSWVDRTPFILINFHWSCSAKGSLPKRREHCLSASCKGAEEKHELYIRTCWPSDSWVQLEQRRVKEAGEHTFQLLFTSGFRVPATIHLWVLGSRFQVPDPMSQIPGPRSRSRDSGYPPYMEVKSNGSTKKQAPTTLLPLFPATNPDIPLKELKAFFPYKLLGKLRIRASPSLQGCTPRQVEDSRQSDGSFGDVQETLRVAHPRGSREKPE